MSEQSEIIDVLLEIRDTLDDIKLQHEIALKYCVSKNNDMMRFEKKMQKYKIKLLEEAEEQEDV